MSEKEIAMSGFLSTTHDDLREIPERIHRPGSACFQSTGITAVVALILTVALSSPQSKPVLAGGRPEASPNVQATEPANLSAFLAEIHWTLKKQHDQMIKLANEMLGSPLTVENLRDQYVNQRITTESAKANFENAKLTREVAEIAVLEYEEGIFIQDKATLQGEISLAESNLHQARDAILGTKDRLAQSKGPRRARPPTLPMSMRSLTSSRARIAGYREPRLRSNRPSRS
jgi:hypothetical protein